MALMVSDIVVAVGEECSDETISRTWSFTYKDTVYMCYIVERDA